MTSASLETARPRRGERNALLARFEAVRRQTEALAAPLSPEDQTIQTMPDVSPTKWHRAHTTWFFENFLLTALKRDYTPFNEAYGFLFNSYYVQVGPRHFRAHRGHLSRPGVAEIADYRAHVDRAMADLIGGAAEEDLPEIERLTVLGCHHEQQHQELLLTDIKHVLGENPLKPAYAAPKPSPAATSPDLTWVGFEGGVYEIGFEGQGFAYDNEGPRHRQLIESFELANRPVTCRDYLAFMEEGGYGRSEFWLSDGWAAVQERGWEAPGYWQRSEDGAWEIFTLSGARPVNPEEPVSHVSFFEANAFAHWASLTWTGARLPSEAEWELAAASVPVQGTFAGGGQFHPAVAAEGGSGLKQMFGDVWEWTQSPYTPYRGFKAASGAIGEYNGKFMSGQMVLRGGSCATPDGHIRPTYRNFFYPPDRWQFSGLRLARDI